jgi:hypothetical protein
LLFFVMKPKRNQRRLLKECMERYDFDVFLVVFFLWKLANKSGLLK